MIGHELRQHLQVFYGLGVALLIVVLLTPAVGGMARLLGVVDRPGEGRRANTRTVPRLGGLALFPGTFALIELDLGRANAAILAAIVVGATVGFLRHNFYPARIFMGDSGALLLGFTLAGISVEGLLKTASLVSLFLPLAVLAVPIIDTSFVVAKRLKHRLPVYEGDRFHLHHRFLNIGYSQRRAVLTIYAWCATLAAAALATRFVKPHPHGEWRAWAIAVDAAIGLAALAASMYIVYLLEIVKLANPIMRRREQLRRTA